MFSRPQSPYTLRSNEPVSVKGVQTPQRTNENWDKSKQRSNLTQTPKTEANDPLSSLADVAGISMPSSAVVAALYKEREEKRKLMHQLRWKFTFLICCFASFEVDSCNFSDKEYFLVTIRPSHLIIFYQGTEFCCAFGIRGGERPKFRFKKCSLDSFRIWSPRPISFTGNRIKISIYFFSIPSMRGFS